MTPPAGRERCFRLVALGDSITVGVGDTVGPDAAHGPGWAAHLAAVLGAEAFTNLATNGSRSRDVAGPQLEAALTLRPHLATVLVGGNDVLRSDFDARLTLMDLRRCVSELTGAGTDVVLVLLPVIGLFELGPRLVRRVMRRRVASINAAVQEVAASAHGLATDGPAAQPVSGDEPTPISRHGRVVVVDATRAIAPAVAKAWHVDRVHPSPAGHRQLALAATTALADMDPEYAPPPVRGSDQEWVRALAARLPEAPDPPSVRQRLGWLVRAGLPWCVRRGRDFLPGLLRAVVHDLRAERVLAPGSMVTSLADSGLDPRRRIRRG
ncbi:SGNH/GDSL hydrolase family protein [Promicromonospora iranensis]|uniref:Lysophospholipase L1-like esterase n=1 Tax=Promicromonospora iranensis TaxID=1105144 RepID=A0ABU2CQK1_9MICO|nr:SGNH/GDSL hydrolase family protein [Promicromonospora iranensis]MDR7383613.1 lysophospholipase L1-like esterase [Promicromonospora iranensis]